MVTESLRRARHVENDGGNIIRLAADNRALVHRASLLGEHQIPSRSTGCGLKASVGRPERRFLRRYRVHDVPIPQSRKALPDAVHADDGNAN